MRTPRPFIIRQDGTLLDRASGDVVGRVWLQVQAGWYAENQTQRFGPWWARHIAARRAWDDWCRTDTR